MFFFAVEAFARLRNFFKICRRNGCSIIRFVKVHKGEKLQLLVINSYTSEIFLKTCNEMK